MKEGWKYVKLGEVCKIFNGNSINADYKKTHFEGLDEGFPFIATKDVSFDGKICYNNGVKIPFNTDFKKANPGSIFICAEGGSAGRKIAYLKETVCFGNKLFCIEPKEESIDGHYLFYYHLSSLFQKQFKNLMTGLIGGVSAKKFKDIVFYYPPLPEQQRIVEQLDSSFAKIDALKANAEKLVEEAKALFASALREAMKPKEGWEEKKLGEICDKITDGTHNSPPNCTCGDYKYITAKNIKVYGLDLSDITYVTKEIHDEIYSRCNPQKGDVLFIKDGATTGIAIINPLEEEFSLLSSVALIKTNKTILTSEYLCYAMNSPMFYDYVRSKMEGAAITRVTLKKIKDFPLALPLLPEQSRIVSTLDALSAQVRQLEANFKKVSEECDALKQAILRETFE